MAEGFLHVREVSRRLVQASDPSDAPQVLAVSNLDLLDTDYPVTFVCVYPSPPAGSFDAVVATFEAALPSFLNHFFPLAGRIVRSPATGLPEIHCNNEGAELVVGDAGGVPLSSLDLSSMGASLCRLRLPYDDRAVALSVQLVSFACGGFSVLWSSSHVVADGCATCMLIDAWSRFVRNNGALGVGGVVPFHDRGSVLQPRSPPSYGPSFGDAYTPDTPEHRVNVLANQSFVERLYLMEARDVERLRRAATWEGEGCAAARSTTRMEAVSAFLWKALAGVVGDAGDARCRMGWWVNGRPHISPSHRPGIGHDAAMHGYFGNAASFAVREATVEEILRSPPPDVASLVREAVAATANPEHFQELVDWLEEHKPQKYVEAPIVGLGSPTLAVSWFASFRPDTDFGFGRAALAMPMVIRGRDCSGYMAVAARPGGDGDLFVSAFLWPRLAAALESDAHGILKPLTPENLGFFTRKNASSFVRPHVTTRDLMAEKQTTTKVI